jgi:hypothetical protein
MNKHFIANKYLPIALALAAFTAAGTAPVLAQQSSAYARITDHSAVAPSSVGRPDPFGENEWFNR